MGQRIQHPSTCLRPFGKKSRSQMPRLHIDTVVEIWLIQRLKEIDRFAQTQPEC